MLVRALYVSRAVGPQTGTVTARILAAAQAHNAAHGISGVLCQGQGLYLQVLEGDRAEVNRLYASILKDPRHRDVQMLAFEEIAQRRYPDWSMAHVHLPDDDAMVRFRDSKNRVPSALLLAQASHQYRTCPQSCPGSRAVGAAPAALVPAWSRTAPALAAGQLPRRPARTTLRCLDSR
jgi:hypothetical protein